MGGGSFFFYTRQNKIWPILFEILSHRRGPRLKRCGVSGLFIAEQSRETQKICICTRHVCEHVRWAWQQDQHLMGSEMKNNVQAQAQTKLGHQIDNNNNYSSR